MLFISLYIVLGVEGVGWSHPDYMPLMIIASLIGELFCLHSNAS